MVRYVSQKDEGGCFVACIAMIRGISYQKAFNLVHPIEPELKNIFDPYGWLPIEEAIAKIPSLGINARKVNIRKISSLKHNALIFIRWAVQPRLMHSVVFDFSRRKILDPIFKPQLNVAAYERQLDSIYYVS